MTHRIRALSTTSLLVSFAVGCSATTSEEPSRPKLEGVYQSAAAGPIDRIAFGVDEFIILPASCPTASPCPRYGRYAIDDERDAILLTEDDGTTTTMPLAVLETNEPRASVGLVTRGLVPQSVCFGTAQSCEAAMKCDDDPQGEGCQGRYQCERYENGALLCTSGSRLVEPSSTPLVGSGCDGTCATKISVGGQPMRRTDGAAVIWRRPPPSGR